ncbi:MAG: sulfotransferase [Thermoplasmata archaeon]|nr:sulfotransferase [Thermoplasmata archaeon]
MKLKFNKDAYLNFSQQPLGGSSFTNWLYLLAENKFCIDWRFVPRALYVTMLILFLTPSRIKEKRMVERKLRDVEIVPPLFIVGHFRSGTTFLHYLMGQDKSLAYVSTFETMAPWVLLNDKLRKLVEERLPEKRPMDDLEMDAGLPYEEEYAIANLCSYSFYHGWYFPKKINYYFRKYVLFEGVSEEVKQKWKNWYEYLLKKITLKHDGKRILLKSPVNTGRIKLLLEIFPDAKFIHIYPNPYKVYLSTWRLYEKILPIFSFQHIEKEMLDRFILDFYKEVYSKYFEEKHLIDKGNLVEISYEEFVKEPMKKLKWIYEKLGLDGFEKAEPYFRRYVEKHKNYKPHSYVITDKIREKVYSEWKFAFDEFGYKK